MPPDSRSEIRNGPGKPNQRKASSWTFPGGIPEQKFNVNRACFPKGKTPEFTKIGEIHELFVSALFWFGLPGPLLMKTSFETVAEIVFEIAGTKLWQTAGEKLL